MVRTVQIEAHSGRGIPRAPRPCVQRFSLSNEHASDFPTDTHVVSPPYQQDIPRLGEVPSEYVHNSTFLGVWQVGEIILISA